MRHYLKNNQLFLMHKDKVKFLLSEMNQFDSQKIIQDYINLTICKKKTIFKTAKLFKICPLIITKTFSIKIGLLKYKVSIYIEVKVQSLNHKENIQRKKSTTMRFIRTLKISKIFFHMSFFIFRPSFVLLLLKVNKYRKLQK